MKGIDFLFDGYRLAQRFFTLYVAVAPAAVGCLTAIASRSASSHQQRGECEHSHPGLTAIASRSASSQRYLQPADTTKDSTTFWGTTKIAVIRGSIFLSGARLKNTDSMD